MGMPEYRDGTLGPIMPIDEAMERLKDPDVFSKTKALHVGSFAELVERAKEIHEKAREVQMEAVVVAVKDMQADINRILIHLGLDDKTKVLGVKQGP